MAKVTLTMTTIVPVSTGEAWAWSTSLEGVRTEMRPLLKVVFPRAMTHIGPDTALNTVLGRCQFLLFGLFPIDMSKLRFTEMEPGHRFVEESDLLSMRSWRHRAGDHAVGRWPVRPGDGSPGLHAAPGHARRAVSGQAVLRAPPQEADAGTGCPCGHRSTPQ